jgi:hypothetical protein
MPSDYPSNSEHKPRVESPSADRMQGAPGSPRRSAQDDGAEAGLPRRSAQDDGAEAGLPRRSAEHDDRAEAGDQDIDTAGTAHDDLSPTKSM